MQRYDRFTFKATKTDEGFIIDKPIIGRTGILRYQNADGSERIEYRPPEEAFNADSLASIKGKPITLGHVAMVNNKNSKSIPILGTVISGGEQDGDNIRADITLYNLDTPHRELSCGYTLDLDEHQVLRLMVNIMTQYKEILGTIILQLCKKVEQAMLVLIWMVTK